jgi:ATP-binding cassette subfamily B protein
MIDTHDEGHVVSRLDGQLIRRLLGLAQPFLRLMLLSGFFLLIATVGEMLIPVLIQQSVDRVILESWVPADPSFPAGLIGAEGERRVGGQLYVREQDLDRLPRATRDTLRGTGSIGIGGISIVRNAVVQSSQEVQELLQAADVVHDEHYWAIPGALLRTLSPSQRRILRADSLTALQRYAVAFFVVLLVVLIGSFGQVYLTAYIGQLVMNRLRIRLFRHTVDQNLAFLGNQPVGRLVTRVTNDVETINEFFSSVLSELARNVSLMIAVVVTMLALNARLALFVLLTMIPVIFLTNIIRIYARQAFRSVREAVSKVNAYLSEYISGMTLVQLFVQQRESYRDFSARNDTLLTAQLREMYVFAIFRPIVDFLASISTAAVILFGAWLLEVDLVSLGILIAFTNLIRRFYMPVMSISEQFTVLQSAMAGSERVFDLLDQDERIPDTGARPLVKESVAGRVEFQDVCFSYKDGEPVLQHLSFEAKPGQLVAIVGHTGSGKTTVINLLTRLWDTETGRILLDGNDIRDHRRDDLRTSIQQIQQEVFLFDDTIRENITLGLEVPDDVVWSACDAVQIGEFIRSLPHGLDTPLEARGENLSTGQRQLISFARVLVHNPPVLVLDEATSSIDSETERLLQEALKTVTGGRTSLVVAHRLSTIRHADQILVLSQGSIAEMGTHDELIAHDGLYSTLYHLQFQNL